MSLLETFQCLDRDCHAHVNWGCSNVALVNECFVGKDVPTVGYKGLRATVLWVYQLRCNMIQSRYSQKKSRTSMVKVASRGWDGCGGLSVGESSVGSCD